LARFIFVEPTITPVFSEIFEVPSQSQVSTANGGIVPKCRWSVPKIAAIVPEKNL
jgi:hypothetical protein